MQLFINILLLIIGMVVIIYGGDIFVDSSIRIGRKLKIPYIIIGATIVSIATTLPELITSSISAFQGSNGLAIGNAVGSVICNTALVCGISITCLPSLVKEKTGNYKYLMLILALLMLFVFSFNNKISIIESILLFVVFLGFMAINIIDAIKESKAQKSKNSFEFGQVSDQFEVFEVEKQPNQFEKKEELETDNNLKPQKSYVTAILFILGAAMIAFGAWAMVKGATFICETLNINDSLIGLTVIAIGTSLPELITTISSIKKKTASLGYGNIIGANILNVALVISSCGFITGKNGLPVTNNNLYIDFPIAILVSLIFLIPLIFKNKTYRMQGFALLAIYLIFIITSILLEIFKVSL